MIVNIYIIYIIYRLGTIKNNKQKVKHLLLGSYHSTQMLMRPMEKGSEVVKAGWDWKHQQLEERDTHWGFRPVDWLRQELQSLGWEARLVHAGKMQLRPEHLADELGLSCWFQPLRWFTPKQNSAEVGETSITSPQRLLAFLAEPSNTPSGPADDWRCCWHMPERAFASGCFPDPTISIQNIL